jgi:hypothetical protein
MKPEKLEILAHGASISVGDWGPAQYAALISNEAMLIAAHRPALQT